MTLKTVYKNFLNDESGATAIEYALIAALIGVGLIVGAQALATSLNDLYSGVDSELVGAFETTPPPTT